MTLKRTSFFGLLLAIAVGLATARAEPGHAFKPLSPEELAAIARAAPERPRAAPLKQRRILVFFRTEGFVHGSIPYANEALRVIGQRSGAYQADFSDDMAVFTPETLASYDAVVFQNTTGLAFTSPSARAALLAYVGSGKGFVGIHAATDNFNTWPEAQAMIGGHFNGHPWTARDTEAVKVDDPGHPVAAAFAGATGFWIREEIYQITGPFDRTKQRVLLSLDMARPENQRPADLIKRTDSDFPIAWVKTFGKGRVFYTSLGHNPDLYYLPRVLQHYLDGIQFAVGDLPASDEPSATPPSPALAPAAPALTLQEAWFATHLSPDYASTIAAYDFGAERVPLLALDLYLRTQGQKAFPPVETALLGLLARPTLKAGAKDYCLRTLARIGSAASVPALEGLLADSRWGTLALIALNSVRGPEADKALLRALSLPDSAQKVAVINAAVRRGLDAAVPALGGFARAHDIPLASAALIGLGDLGTPEALATLQAVTAEGPLVRTQSWAEISCIDRLSRTQGGVPPAARAQAAALLSTLRGATAPDTLRTAAFALTVRLDPASSGSLLVTALGDERPKVRTAAAVLLGRVLSPALLPDLRARLPTLDPGVQATLLLSLDAANAEAALPLALDSVASPEPSVRQAALRALGSRPEAEATATLVASLDAAPADVAVAAASLGRSKAPGAGKALLAALPGATPAKTAALLKILGARVDARVMPYAAAAIDSPDAAVRAAAFAAVGATATANDLTTVLALLPKAKTTAERHSLQVALLEIVRASAHPEGIVRAIQTALETARGAERGTLLTALSLAGTDTATGTLARLLKDGSATDCRDTLAAIGSSTNTQLLDLVLATAKARGASDEGLLALRTFLDLQLAHDGRTTAQVVAAYASAWPIATRPLEREAILAALRNLKAPEAVLLAKTLSASLPPS